MSLQLAAFFNSIDEARAAAAVEVMDEFGYNVAEDGVHVRDLHPTVLHLLGIDHERLTYRFSGLDFRLTGVEPARVVKEIVA